MIDHVSPVVDGGRYALKRLVGDDINVRAAVFKDGHDALGAEVVIRDAQQLVIRRSPLSYDLHEDMWSGGFTLEQAGNYSMYIEGWPDYFGTWRRDLQKRIDAGQDIRGELLEGAALVRRHEEDSEVKQKAALNKVAASLTDVQLSVESRLRIAFSQTLLDLMAGPLAESERTQSEAFPVRIDRKEAGFAAWYELFPRSQSRKPGRHGTFADTERRLPEIAAMGFDVLYLPPIHPIGTVHRKGRNNSTTAAEGEVGSPWAIGSAEGGHTAVHSELGSISDFENLVQAAQDFGIEIALDIAFQCAPDHPWVKEHPEFFFVLQDGSIRYAENPPKRYEDIYPLNFWGSKELWTAARDAIIFWVERGVKTFRVDNPHTKPLSFWQWCIAEIQAQYPETVFLSESFTRPNRMYGLAKVGFTQSYTYFTWKNTKRDLEEFITEVTSPPVSDFYRPNLFTNTPDILHEYLQKSGRAGFQIRALLAASLSPVYGIYSGFELCEGAAVEEGSEEYLDSEKYEIRQRDWSAPGNIKREISRLNRLRKMEPALGEFTNFSIVKNENSEVFSFLKFDGKSESPRHLLGIVNVDPFQAQETMIQVPIDNLGIKEGQSYQVEDLLTGSTYTWKGKNNYVRLDPSQQVGHLFRIIRP